MEGELGEFVSVEQTAKVTDTLTRCRRELEALVAEWEEVFAAMDAG